jgi:hypothetical protein
MLIVTRNGNPLKFVHNINGAFVNPCKEKDATRFASEDEARVKLVDFKAHGKAYEFQKVEPLGREFFSNLNPNNQ